MNPYKTDKNESSALHLQERARGSFSYLNTKIDMSMSSFSEEEESSAPCARRASLVDYSHNRASLGRSSSYRVLRMSRRTTEKSLALPETAATIRQQRRKSSLKKHKKHFDALSYTQEEQEPLVEPGSFDFYRQRLGLETTIHPQNYVVIKSDFDQNSDARLQFALKRKVARSRSLSSDSNSTSSLERSYHRISPGSCRGLPARSKSFDAESTHIYQRNSPGPCKKLPPKTRSLDGDQLPRLSLRNTITYSGSVATNEESFSATSSCDISQSNHSERSTSSRRRSMRKALLFKSIAIPRLQQESLDLSERTEDSITPKSENNETDKQEEEEEEEQQEDQEEEDCEFEFDLSSKLAQCMPSALSTKARASHPMDDVSVCSSVSMDLDDLGDISMYDVRAREAQDSSSETMDLDDSLHASSSVMDASSTSFRWGGTGSGGSHRRTRRRRRRSADPDTKSKAGGISTTMMNNSCMSLGISKSLTSRRRGGRRPSLHHSGSMDRSEDIPAVFPTRIRRVAVVNAQA